jgi:phage-related minor tail protein
MADDDFLLSSGGSELPATLDSLTARTRGLEGSANAFARAMTQAFSRAVVEGRRLDDVIKGLALRLSNIAVRSAFKPLERALAGGLEGLFGAVTNAKPFADGGVIASPTYFSLGRGLGLAGEAGPEAILPLARGADGKLGVISGGQSAPPHVTVNIATPDAASFQHSEAYLTGMIARAVARGQRRL